MYTEDEEKKGLPIKTFVLSLILVVIFILLLMWLLPMPKNSNNNSNNGDNTYLNSLADRIFNANIQEMKNAALFYFTTDKLPKNDGDSVKLTLQQMLDMKLLLPFTDKNGDSCDTEESYVKLTKVDDHYELKVNLKCPDQEDYIIVELGCYSYCTSAICEKEEGTPSKPTEQSGPSCTLYVSSGTRGNNGWYLGNATVKFKTKSTTNGTITYFGMGTSSTASFNGNSSYTVSKDGTTTVYGYVKDSNGKTAMCSLAVKKDTVKPSCQLKVLSGSTSGNGTYISDVVVGFASKTDATSGVFSYGLTNSSKATFNNVSKYTITTNGTHKVYGYVKDYAGNVSQCDITVTRQKTNTDSVPSCSLKVASGTLGSNGWYTGNVNVTFASKTTTNGAKITAFGLGTSETYAGNNTYTVSGNGSNVVYGYVQDSNGHKATCSITVKKDSVKPSCSLKVTSGTFNSNGYYTSNVVVGFASRTDKESGVNAFGIGKSTTFAGNTTYTISTTGKHTVYGYVRDNAGNVATCSITVEKRDNIEYQYQKSIPNQYSAWTDWTNSTYNPNNKPQFGKFTLLEVEDLGKSTVVDYYKETPGEAFYQYKTIKVGTAQQTYCTGYNYYRDYKTQTTYAVKEGTDWQFAGMVTTTGWPTDSLSVKYEFVGFDKKCSGCELNPKKIWNKYTRTVGTVTSSTTVTTSGVTVKCASTATREIEVFDTVKIFVNYEIVRTPVYKDVYKYRYRQRTLVKKAYTDYVWSKYNDTNLLNNGYTYTGNTRVAG